MADEWTFVTHQTKNPQRRRNQRNGKKGPTQTSSCGSSGLYKASFNDGPSSSIRSRSRHDDDGPMNAQENTSNDHRVQQLKRDILDCLHALEDQVQSGYGFAHNLIASLATATSFTDEHHDSTKTTTTTTQTSNNNQREAKTTTDDNNNNAQQLLNLREIVAYGIGNFATDRFQAPMLQLACLLLLRRCAAINNQQSTTKFATESDTFEYEQHQVPIYYYEPIMSPVEKNLLTNVFHVHVLDSNEMGKRSVESMRPSAATCERIQSQSSSKKPNSSATSLFYMPHCPMQLYSNVLWAHWDHIFFTPTEKKNSPLVIFGNNFQTYDERTISSEKRLDPMNGVFRIIPFAKEDPVSSTPATRDAIIADELRHLEKAFNDCTVISFPVSKEKCSNWPDRPMEWIASDTLENIGELM